MLSIPGSMSRFAVVAGVGQGGLPCRSALKGSFSQISYLSHQTRPHCGQDTGVFVERASDGKGIFFYIVCLFRAYCFRIILFFLLPSIASLGRHATRPSCVEGLGNTFRYKGASFQWEASKTITGFKGEVTQHVYLESEGVVCCMAAP